MPEIKKNGKLEGEDCDCPDWKERKEGWLKEFEKAASSSSSRVSSRASSSSSSSSSRSDRTLKKSQMLGSLHESELED